MYNKIPGLSSFIQPHHTANHTKEIYYLITLYMYRDIIRPIVFMSFTLNSTNNNIILYIVYGLLALRFGVHILNVWLNKYVVFIMQFISK